MEQARQQNQICNSFTHPFTHLLYTDSLTHPLTHFVVILNSVPTFDTIYRCIIKLIQNSEIVSWISVFIYLFTFCWTRSAINKNKNKISKTMETKYCYAYSNHVWCTICIIKVLNNKWKKYVQDTHVVKIYTCVPTRSSSLSTSTNISLNFVTYNHKYTSH